MKHSHLRTERSGPDPWNLHTLPWLAKCADVIALQLQRQAGAGPSAGALHALTSVFTRGGRETKRREEEATGERRQRWEGCSHKPHDTRRVTKDSVPEPSE